MGWGGGYGFGGVGPGRMGGIGALGIVGPVLGLLFFLGLLGLLALGAMWLVRRLWLNSAWLRERLVPTNIRAFAGNCWSS